MHLHRLATFLLGFWLAGLIALSYVATHNFQQVDRLLARPSAPLANAIAPLNRAEARAVLRHQASELNRDYFATFEFAEIVLALLLCALMLSLQSLQTPFRVIGPVLLALVLFSHYALTPSITSIGRKLDFLDPTAQTPERAQFWRLHNLYSGQEVLKMVLILVLGGRLLTQRSRRTRLMESRKKADLVDHRHRSQVDR